MENDSRGRGAEHPRIPTGRKEARVSPKAMFRAELDLYVGILREAGGSKDEDLLRKADEMLGIFTQASTDTQRDIHRGLFAYLDGQLKTAYGRHSNLLHDLMVEGNGSTADDIEEYISGLNQMFENNPHAGKLDLVQRVRREGEAILLERFPIYLEAWHEALVQKQGEPEEKAKERVEELRAVFDGASPRGKVGLAKTVRGNVETAIQTSFHEALDFYRLLRESKGITGDSDEFPNPDRMLYEFGGASRKIKESLRVEVETAINTLVLGPQNA